MRCALTCLLLILALPATAGAAESKALVRQGAHIARMWCANCHVTGQPGQNTALADAPSFQSLAGRPDLTDGAIALALMKPHPPMPQQNLSRDDVRAVTAYIRSLAPGD